MRASRLLSILLILQLRGRQTAQSLADEFEVSVRTIYRDIDHLSAAGVPVYADRGRNGGFDLLDGYKTKLTGLTSSEAESLFLAGLPGAAQDLGFSEALIGAKLKLLAALPPQSREGAERIGARFHLDPVGWYRSSEAADLLPQVADAVWTARRIAVRYERWDGEIERVLAPLGLVMKAGVWYLVATVAGKPRTYRLSNIKALTAGEPFERIKAFDLAAYWTQQRDRFEEGLFQGQATLRVTARGLKNLGLLSDAVAEAARASAGPPDADDRVTVTIPIETVENAAVQLFRLGPEVEVLTPPEFRAAIAERARAVAGLYA
ncbi:YafY family protein [Phenylobacterium sp.]|uniref:helix-turn-helix transcriptional regulator n=1 Tax=Phenylobacterium sp. TaxID=1871053 RepID=UPI00273255BC|nr:WYL domain-containing protein [Phenylobacterium sp.]MDP3854004.1 WYL domain-containing protein [Phenylobacterium sp.]